MTQHVTPSSHINGRKGGGGGGGKKGGHSPAEAKNTLRSRAKLQLVEIISEGEIEGLVDGEKSIYLNETPLEGLDGSRNIDGIHWEFREGLPDQPHFNGAAKVETPYDINVEVKKNEPAIVRSINQEDADAVRVVMRIPSLFKTEKDGDVVGNSVDYKIEVRPYGGTYKEVVRQKLRNQKCTSPWQIAHYIKLPVGGSPWDIRVTRLTNDSTETKNQNSTFWEAMYAVVEGKFTYPNTAAVYIEADSEQAGSNLPERRYHVRGLKINVPSNYDPVRRTYAGIWDGTFKIAWSNNPIWVFYDLLINNRYGLGEKIAPETIDKWAFYMIAQYCDEEVPTGFKDSNGNKTYEPRFVFNGVINQPEEAYNLLAKISTCFRGMAHWSLGRVFATADMPSDPVKLVSPANVVGGHVSYSGTSMKARHSVALISWNDPDDFFRPAVELVINDEMLQQNGWRETSVQGHGISSRGQAHRFGKWILDTEQHETETATYSAHLDHVDVVPGNIIAIADPMKAQARTGGRIVRTDNGLSEVYLDGGFERSDDQNYSLMLAMPDGTIDTKGISNILPFGRNSSSRIENHIIMDGFEVGQTNSAGSLPPSWASTTSIPGVVTDVLGSGIDETGQPYADFRIHGRSSKGSDATLAIVFNRDTHMPRALPGQTWTASCLVEMLEEPVWPDGTSFQLLTQLRNHPSATSIATTYHSIDSFTLGKTELLKGTVTSDDTEVTGARAYVRLTVFDDTPVDFSFRIKSPILNQASDRTEFVPATNSRVILKDALREEPVKNAMWAITGTDVAPRQYRVLSVRETEKDQVTVSALFHDPQKFDRVEQDLLLDPIPYSRIDTTIQAPEQIDVTEFRINNANEKKIKLLVSWSASRSMIVSHYNVEIITPSGQHIRFSDVYSQSVEIENSLNGEFEIKVMAVSHTGSRSRPVEKKYAALGWLDEAYPADITSFKSSVIGDMANLSWNRIDNFTPFTYTVKFSSNPLANWNTATVVEDGLHYNRLQVPARKGTYFVKAVSATGVESQTAAMLQVNALASIANVFENLTEEAETFTGHKSGIKYDAGYKAYLLETNEENGEYIGHYTRDGFFDLSEIHTSRLIADLDGYGVNLEADLFVRADFFDLEDYFASTPGQWDIWVELRYTNEAPNDGGAFPDYGVTWSEWEQLTMADYTARAFQFRVVLRSKFESITPVLRSYNIHIDMPDRVVAGDDISAPVGGKSIVFDGAFKSLQGLAVSAQDMVQGDYYRIMNKSRSGFKINFYNSAGSAVSRTFDYVAKGYGRVLEL
jgi:predicted phage tail protein